MLRAPSSKNLAERDAPVSIAVAAVLQYGPEGVRVLICKRLAEAIRGGLWEFPGGKIEVGESAAVAAAREVLEETGLKVDSCAALPVCDLGHHESDAPAESRLRFFMVAFRAPPDAAPRPLASSECKWERLQGLDQYEWPKANAALISHLRAWAAAQEGPS